VELAEKYQVVRQGGKLDPEDPLAEFLTKQGLVIPNKYLAPYLQDLLSRWETGTVLPIKRPSRTFEGKVNSYQNQREYNPINMVAELLGVGITKFRQMVEGEGHTRFFTVDRILTELDLTHLWYEDEALALAYSLVR
jgi:hypothetical protein